LPALFQTGCAPGLCPSEVAHACGEATFLPLRTDGWFRIRPLVRASTPRRQIPPLLGFTPQECPSSDYGCYPVTWLAPLLGFSSLRLVFRPAWFAFQQTSARWLIRLPVTRQARNCHSAYSVPADHLNPRNLPAKASKPPDLAIGNGPRNLSEVCAPFHDSVAEGGTRRISLIFSRSRFVWSPRLNRNS